MVESGGLQLGFALLDVFLEDALGAGDNVDEVAEGGGAVGVLFGLAPQLLCHFALELGEAGVAAGDFVEGALHLCLGEGGALAEAQTRELLEDFVVV